MHCDWGSELIRLWTYGERQERDDTMICLDGTPSSRDHIWSLAFSHERMQLGRYLMAFWPSQTKPRMQSCEAIVPSVSH